MLLVTPIHRPINIIAFLLNWTTMGGVDDWSNFHLQRDTFYARVGVVINEAIADSSTLPLWRRNGQPTATSLLPSPIHGSVKFKVRRCATQAVQRACSPHYYLVVLLLSHHPVLAVLGYGPLSDRGCHHSNGNDNYMLRDGGNLKKYDKTIPRASAFLFMIRLWSWIRRLDERWHTAASRLFFASRYSSLNWTIIHLIWKFTNLSSLSMSFLLLASPLDLFRWGTIVLPRGKVM